MEQNLPHLEAKWFQFIRFFLRHINITLEIDETYISPCQQENDTHIMDHVIDSQQFSAPKVKKAIIVFYIYRFTLFSI